MNRPYKKITQMEAPADFTLLTAPQIAKACNVSRRTVDNWLKTRKVPYVKIGASVRFHRPSVMAALAKFTVHPVTI